MRFSRSQPLDVDTFVTVNRRSLLRGLGAGTLVTAGGLFTSQRVWADPVFGAWPFSLGIASGDPAPDGFVIWTKIAPKPLEPHGGMPAKAVSVTWTVANDDTLRDVVQTGTALAYPELGHAVHVEVSGLAPEQDYYYAFRIGDERSRVGRARTLPPAGAPLRQLRFALAGCQRYDDGYYTAYREIARERYDFLFHYGDYIYEERTLRPGERGLPVVRTMPGEPDTCMTLTDYRHRYALYKLDPDLQAAHRSCPFIMSFDDHEVANNWAGDISAVEAPRELFLLRRAAAFQAWYEHMPVRRAQLPRGPDVQAYRRLAFGDLLTLNVLDTRQYRSDQPCGDGIRRDCKDALDPNLTILGPAQERWLYDQFGRTQARWNALGQQFTMMRLDYDTDPAVVATHMDKWDGAAAARERLLVAARDAKLANMIVLTGDIHNNWAGELKANFDDERSATLGVEFIGTSISSGGDGYDTNARSKLLLEQNPHVKFYNNQRGYMRHTVTPDRWLADFRVLENVSTRDGAMKTRQSFVVESGKPAIVPG